MKKIAIFGGSFNPITYGHLNIAQFAIDELNLDQLIFVPAYQSPFKKKQVLAAAHHRIKMIELVLKPKMTVSPFELNRKSLSYTIDTVKYFKNKHQDDQLFLIIGSDHLEKLNKWKEIETISKLAQIVVFRRSKNIYKLNLKKFNGILLNNEINHEASSRFFQGNFFDLDPKVLKYIGQEKIYFEKILESSLSQKRYLHCLHTKTYAIELAKSLNFDPAIAGFCGLVHDLAKEIDDEVAKKLIKRYEPQSINLEKYKLHQEVGYIILKHIFQIDEAIAHSIRVHTSLALELSLLDKIVFMADKLCQGRKWEGIQKIRDLSLRDFDQAFKIVVQKTREFNLDKGIELTPEQEQIYQKWIN